MTGSSWFSKFSFKDKWFCWFYCVFVLFLGDVLSKGEKNTKAMVCKYRKSWTNYIIEILCKLLVFHLDWQVWKNPTSSQSINQSFVYCHLLQRSWIVGGVSTLNYNIKHNNSIAFTIIVQRIFKTPTVRTGRCSWVWQSGLWLPSNYMA